MPEEHDGPHTYPSIVRPSGGGTVRVTCTQPGCNHTSEQFFHQTQAEIAEENARRRLAGGC